jgi:cytochrome P450
MAMHPQPRERSSTFRAPAPVPHARPLGPIALLRTLKSNPIECWTQAHFEEPIVIGGFPFGRVAVVSEPAAIRKVLVENSANYRKSALQRRILSVRLREGLVAVEGDQWHRQRRTLAPLFGRKMVTRFASAMASAAAALVERWRCRQEDGLVDITAEMSRLALDALLRTVFSDGLDGDPEVMRVAMMSFFAATGSIDPFDVVGLPDFVPRITQRRVRPMLRSVDQALNAIIVARRLTLVERSGAAPRDMLTVLLSAQDPETGRRMSDAEVKANILTFFVAGQETTAAALTWAVYLLSQAPDWCARVMAESERKWSGPVEELAHRLADTRAAIEEAMRLYPPIIGLSRTAIQPDELVGRTIKRGTMVVISPWVLHRHRLLWDDPDLFDPTRFLEGAHRTIERHAYLPFGVGPRMCIGAAFALQEATIALATIMRNFTLRLAPGQSVWPRQTMTLRPRDGLHMAVRRNR